MSGECTGGRCGYGGCTRGKGRPVTGNGMIDFSHTVCSFFRSQAAWDPALLGDLDGPGRLGYYSKCEVELVVIKLDIGAIIERGDRFAIIC